METILLLAAVEPDGSLAKPALESLTAASSLLAALPGSTFVVALFGDQTTVALNQVAYCGASRFLTVCGPEFAASRYATDALAAEALCRAAAATIVIAPGTLRLARCLPGVAQRLGGRADTHIASLTAEQGTLAVNRWYYRQRMEARFTRTARPWLLLIDPGTHAAWSGAAGQIAAEDVSVTVPDAARRTTVTGLRQPAVDAQTIRPDADLLFVTGAGWTKKQSDGQSHVPEAEKLILDFLNVTRSSLGSSKSLVDIGGEGQAVLSFLSHLNQIGQTGSTPRHAKGLSTCCHGEEPHTVGWRFINERRAISLDPNCGWARGKADVLYVADAFAVMRKVNELLVARTAAQQAQQ